ncbi:molybdate ABC transporter substrate-binding protein [Aneurinibacillus tyrosinisolvens]|uniref:molybdate ABC transporter substrate-binding protein n=1 Tax=Aneurinibacillus tyrosinisolvens TaxID=1443435 RepID=UPI00063FB0BE|nr:molybdate ABC transporter substrate-binding protein [Aneurinibacillus tyrosinisolvens]
MYKKFKLLVFVLLLLFIPLGCSSNEKTEVSTSSTSASGQKVELMVSAAASLMDVLKEVKASFEQDHPDIRLTYSFGSSGKLAQQIEQGAPADVFLSASEKYMDQLEEKNLILQGSRVDFAKNELVLITNKESSLNIPSFESIQPKKVKQVAIGEPESVPAGRYTKEVFEKLNLWDKLQSKFVLGNNVRQVLTYVESNNAELGVVYASDALISQKVKVLATANSQLHKPIVYPEAIIASSQHPNEGNLFISYLSSEKGKAILKKYGFE